MNRVNVRVIVESRNVSGELMSAYGPVGSLEPFVRAALELALTHGRHGARVTVEVNR